MNRNIVCIGVFILLILCGSWSLAADHPPWEPQARNIYWIELHMKLTTQVRLEQPNILFIGDSITAGWGSQGKEIWRLDYLSRRSSNLGISGDTTQNVLWRIDHGELDGIAPKVTVLLIGTNNIRSSAQDIAHGITAVVSRIQEHLPKTRILLLALFPRNQTSKMPNRQKVVATNALLSQIPWGHGITYLDIGRAFLASDGSISTEIMSDFIHPTDKGYLIWAHEMDPTLDALLQ